MCSGKRAGRWMAVVPAAVLLVLAGCKAGPEVRQGPVVIESVDDPARPALEAALSRLEADLPTIREVSAELERQESSGGRLQPKETIIVLERTEPRALHLTWTEGPDKGRHVLWVQDDNDGKVLVKLGGWKGRVSGILALDPDGPVARAGSRYPVPVIGYHRLLERVVRNYKASVLNRSPAVHDLGSQQLPDRRIHEYEVVLNCPAERGCDYGRMLLWFDDRGLLVRFAGYGHDDRLIEDYFWHNLRINPGLADTDFVLEPAPPAGNRSQ